jgi:hypothetical protein
VKSRQLEAFLRLLEKHPRVTSLTVGDVSITLGDAPPPVAATGTEEDRDESLELPPGVPDPRERIREIYRKANLKRDGKVPS